MKSAQAKNLKIAKLPGSFIIIIFMEKIMALISIVLVAMLTTSTTLFGNVNEKIWTLIGDQTNNSASFNTDELPTHYSVFNFDEEAFRRSIAQVPPSSERAYLPMPTPEGSLIDYLYWSSEVMHSDLAVLNPDLNTFQGQKIDDERDTIRFDSSPTGFRGQVHASKGLFYISPLNRNIYIVYYAKDYRQNYVFSCQNPEEPVPKNKIDVRILPNINYGTVKRTYRLAVATTGEYTAALGGTKALALSSIVTAINFINAIYESEVGVKLQLIPNNNDIIYENALTDPFTPENGRSSMLPQNQHNTDRVIGNANYDIGHLLHALSYTSNSASGLAAISATCRNTVKAEGVSSSSRVGVMPINPLSYRLLAHELGHQFGAEHSFNSSCNNNRNDATAYEPGGGSTIMSYAGGCSTNNVTMLTDTYFHRVSLEEISAFLSGIGSTCDDIENTGNTIPSAEAGSSYTIPRSTPFALTGTGADPNNDSLTYSWEQYNNEIAVMPPSSSSTRGPNFRSFSPTISPIRYFPRLEDILANTTSIWEVLPSVSRTMNYSLVVRDGFGGASSDNTVVIVDGSSGPFLVLSPNGGETLSGTIFITWSPNNTTLAPIHAAQVDILLSTDNGITFPIVLADNTPNDGSQSIVLPNISSDSARIQIKAEGNIFFDVSNEPFLIRPVS
jgi:hypothetical protein